LSDQHATAAAEIAQKERFAFGSNWQQFLRNVGEAHIRRAEQSLTEMLKLTNFTGLRFLDVGCGSGLFSLAARRLGAQVYSFDYDPQCVACAEELKARYFPNDPNWTVAQGSALDTAYLKSLGQHDIVYSWGVLHHTGQMWQALDNVLTLCVPGGRLYIAIYNDQGRASDFWKAYKRLYNRSGALVRRVLTLLVTARFWTFRMLRDFARGKPFASWRAYADVRGMSPWYDMIDWAGGYPFEVATPEQIIEFYKQRGCTPLNMKTQLGSIGCNEFVFAVPDQPGNA
jgi:2-polyprenyl-6-hydroxyphenyl methylase/3-demethylubiquinone-9 3-methyltransferase